MAEKKAHLLRRACFFDRDGVANVEVDYLHEPEKTVLEEGFARAVKLAHANGFLAIVVTNQAGVARGKYPEEDIFKVHARLQELLAEYGEKIDAFYYCPHHPEHSGECNCRKPAPGMLLRAAEEWNIDLAASLMIGDRASDVEAGRNAGCRRSYLVLTGYGKKVMAKNPDPDYPVAANSFEALQDFLQQDDCEEISFAEKIWNGIRRFFLPRLNKWFFLRLAITVIAAFLIFSFLLVPCVISGPSMQPTVPSTGFTFCWCGSYWFKKPALGDIVIIKYDRGVYLLKRIVAMPGDTVAFRNGKLVVNGLEIDEPYVVYPCTWDMPPKTVAADEFYVVGDNRSMPLHLHMQGSVKAYRIIGQPAF